MTKLAGKTAPFNPGSMKLKDLENLLVGKEKEVSTLVNQIATAAKEKTAPPQNLVIGPRGYGKTHLLNVVYHHLIKKKSIKKNLVIAFLKEEAHVHSYLDFLRRVIDSLNENSPDPEMKKMLQQIYDNPSDKIIPSIEDGINNFIEDRLLLIIFENLGDIFDGLEENGQKRLRAFLQESKKISLLAAAQRLFAPIELRTFPFYGFFVRTNLQPLDEEDSWELILRLAQLKEDELLIKFLDTPKGKARAYAVQGLTNGNPRLITLLAEYLNEESLEELAGAFKQLVEISLTPYYQEQMNRLSPLQKRVIEVLCEKGDGKPLTVKEIAKRTLTSSQSISSQLGKMEELGVLSSKKKGRNTNYEMAEPLWRISIEVKNNKEGILPIVVEFIKIIKTPRDLFSGVMQADPSSKLIYDYLTCALRERINSLKKPQRTRFVSQQIKAICKALPNDPKKAESLTKTLAETNQREWPKALHSVFKLIENPQDKTELKHLKFFAETETDDEQLELAKIISSSWNFFATLKLHSHYFSVIKFLIQAYELKIYDPTIFQEIYFEDPISIDLVANLLDCFSGKNECTNWLLKYANHKDYWDIFVETIISLTDSELALDNFTLVLDKIDDKLLQSKKSSIINILGNMLYFAEKEQALEQFFSWVGKRFPTELQFVWILTFAGVIIKKDQKTVELWKKNKDTLLKSFSHLAEPQKMRDIMSSADAFSKGDAEALADFPMEIRSIFQEIAKISK